MKIALALIAVFVVFVVFVVFESAVRLIPPDAVHYTVEYSLNGGPVTTKTGTITDPKTIARWRAAMTATPSGRLLFEFVIRQWQGNPFTCAPLGYYSASYTFSWHGLPLEGVSRIPNTCLEQYEVSSGGIPDPRAYLVDSLIQP
jgi:hypothetical protein